MSFLPFVSFPLLLPYLLQVPQVLLKSLHLIALLLKVLVLLGWVVEVQCHDNDDEDDAECYALARVKMTEAQQAPFSLMCYLRTKANGMREELEATRRHWSEQDQPAASAAVRQLARSFLLLCCSRASSHSLFATSSRCLVLSISHDL